MPTALPAPQLTGLLLASPEINQTEYWTNLQNSFFCDCPEEYSIEDYNGGYTVYLGRCNHRHGYNITGKMFHCEVDKPRLDQLIAFANKGLYFQD